MMFLILLRFLFCILLRFVLLVVFGWFLRSYFIRSYNCYFKIWFVKIWRSIFSLCYEGIVVLGVFECVSLILWSNLWRILWIKLMVFFYGCVLLWNCFWLDWIMMIELVIFKEGWMFCFLIWKIFMM